MFPDGRTLNTFRRWQHMGKKAASYFPVRVTYLTEAQYDLMGGVRLLASNPLLLADYDLCSS